MYSFFDHLKMSAKLICIASTPIYMSTVLIELNTPFSRLDCKASLSSEVPDLDLRLRKLPRQLVNREGGRGGGRRDNGASQSQD